jgi:hypothetical protein
MSIPAMFVAKPRSTSTICCCAARWAGEEDEYGMLKMYRQLQPLYREIAAITGYPKR